MTMTPKPIIFEFEDTQKPQQYIKKYHTISGEHIHGCANTLKIKNAKLRAKDGAQGWLGAEATKNILEP